MKLIHMIKRFWLIMVSHNAMGFAEWVTEVADYDLEIQIREASDPVIKGAWGAVRKSKEQDQEMEDAQPGME